ncbi:MAG: hypothetical protein FJ012_04855 [Chloroflexi bacterium]|nr:hypothetical protein [Chloroflexota bacterium]
MQTIDLFSVIASGAKQSRGVVPHHPGIATVACGELAMTRRTKCRGGLRPPWWGEVEGGVEEVDS